MLRPLFLAALIFPVALLRADSPVLTLENTLLPSPAAVGAHSLSLSASSDGALALLWLEPDTAVPAAHALRISDYSVAENRWLPGRTVVADSFFDTAQPPRLALGPAGRRLALWTVRTFSDPLRTAFSFSTDHGVLWSPPRPFAALAEPTRTHALASFPDGTHIVLRIVPSTSLGAAASLHALRLAPTEFSDARPASTLVDENVSASGGLSVVTFPDNTALVAYRAQNENPAASAVRLARFRAGNWSRPPSPDPRAAAEIALAPPAASPTPTTPFTPPSPPSLPSSANASAPPVLSGQPGRVTLAWFDAASSPARVLAAQSRDAGERFFLPLTVDDGRPLGGVDVVTLRDGSAYVSWLESYGTGREVALWLRRLAPNGDLSVPVLLARADTAAALDHPRLALAKDYDATPARLLLAYTLRSGEISQLVTRLLTLPPPETFSTGRPCGTCPPAEDTLPGFAIRGRILRLEAQPGRGVVVLRHDAIPGVLAAEERRVRVDISVLPSLAVGADVFARIENRAGEWWLFDIRTLSRGPR